MRYHDYRLHFLPITMLSICGLQINSVCHSFSPFSATLSRSLLMQSPISVLVFLASFSLALSLHLLFSSFPSVILSTWPAYVNLFLTNLFFKLSFSPNSTLISPILFLYRFMDIRYQQPYAITMLNSKDAIATLCLTFIFQTWTSVWLSMAAVSTTAPTLTEPSVAAAPTASSWWVTRWTVNVSVNIL